MTLEEEENIIFRIESFLYGKGDPTKKISPWPFHSLLMKSTPIRFDLSCGEPAGASDGIQRSVTHTHPIAPHTDENPNAENDINFFTEAPEFIHFLLNRNLFLREEILRLKKKSVPPKQEAPAVVEEKNKTAITHEELLKKYQV